MTKLPPFELERYLTQHEFSAPYLLCSSDCESLSLKELLGFEYDARSEFDNLWLGYTESSGNPKLRQAVASLYERISPEDVLVHTGAEEAIFTFMNVALRAGDHVMVHWPCYQSLFQIAESLGCEITKWEANPNDGWELDVEFLKKAIKKNTKAIILNCPHNPTGYLMERSKFKELMKVVEHHGVILFMDEVYKGLEYDLNSQLPSACDLDENAVSLGVMSKSLGLAGLRIGWVATKNHRILEEMSKFKDYLSICNSAPSEFLAMVALKNRTSLLKRNREIIEKNIGLLNEFFNNYKEQFECVRPKAGCIAFPKLKGGKNADPFCEEVLSKTGVLLAPGSRFGFDPAFFRIGFGRQNCDLALEALRKYLPPERLELPRPFGH